MTPGGAGGSLSFHYGPPPHLTPHYATPPPHFTPPQDAHGAGLQVTLDATVAAQRDTTLRIEHVEAEFARERQQLQAEAERLRSQLRQQASVAQQHAADASRASAEAEASRSALVAQAAQVTALSGQVQRQNSRIAELYAQLTQERDASSALWMGIADEGGNVVLSPGAAALVHFSMPGLQWNPRSLSRFCPSEMRVLSASWPSVSHRKLAGEQES